MRGTETKMDLEFGIYKKSTRGARHKWVVAIPHDVIREFLGVRRLHRKNEVYFHHWTIPRGSDVLVCFSLSRTKEKLAWSPRGAAALKLTIHGNGPFGICNPSLRRIDGVAGFIPVPDRYESSRRQVSATAEMNGGNPVYSFPIPSGWEIPPLTVIPTRSGTIKRGTKVEIDGENMTITSVGKTTVTSNNAERNADDYAAIAMGLRDQLNDVLKIERTLSAYVRDDGTVGLRRRAVVEL